MSALRVCLATLEAFFLRLQWPYRHFREVRLITPDICGAQQSFFTAPTQAVAIASRVSGSANVYVSASPRSTAVGSRRAVTIVDAAWADLDFHQLDAGDRHHAERLAHERLAALGRPPSILVHTGNGLQAWWQYRKPLPIRSAADAVHAEAINRGIAATTGGDAVHDIARVLRVPGTMNLPDSRKRGRGCVPVMARLLDADGPMYDSDDFADLAVAVRPVIPSRRIAPDIEVPDHPNPEVATAFLELIESLNPRHPLVRTWRGEREPADTSRSGWDMALAIQLVRAGVQDEFIPHVLRSYPKGRGRLASADYLTRTIAKAQHYAGQPRETARHR